MINILSGNEMTSTIPILNDIMGLCISEKHLVFDRKFFCFSIQSLEIYWEDYHFVDILRIMSISFFIFDPEYATLL